VKALASVTVAVLAALPATATAQPSPSTFNVRDATVDLAVPESPAFAALGVSPQEVSRPTSARELATSLLNGVDLQGNFQTGVAIDTAPYLLAAGKNVRLVEDYQQSYGTRFLSRWQASFATTRGTDSDSAVRAALGFRFTLFDRGDPRMDGALLRCLTANADAVLKSLPPVPPGTEADAVDAENARREELVRDAGKPCREAAARRRWNRSAWIAGVAPTWTSPDGTSARFG
jgi:hypothetical protein